MEPKFRIKDTVWFCSSDKAQGAHKHNIMEGTIVTLTWTTKAPYVFYEIMDKSSSHTYNATEDMVNINRDLLTSAIISAYDSDLAQKKKDLDMERELWLQDLSGTPNSPIS